MGGLSNYRIAFAIDMFLLWIRKGGRFSLFALVVAAITDFAVNSGQWSAWITGVALAVAAITGLYAARGCVTAFSIWKRGLESAAVVASVEKSVDTGHTAGKSPHTRLHFSYSVDGAHYQGTSSWGSPGRTGLLAPGARIPIRYLSEDPGVAFWQEDLPLSFPPVNFR